MLKVPPPEKPIKTTVSVLCTTLFFESGELEDLMKTQEMPSEFV